MSCPATELTVLPGITTLLRMPLTSEDLNAVTSWQVKRGHLELERLTFKGISFGATERLFLLFGPSYVDVMLRLPKVRTPRTIVIVERPEPLTWMSTCESTLAESYLQTQPTEAELREIGGRLLGLLRKPEPSRVSRLISESG